MTCDIGIVSTEKTKPVLRALAHKLYMQQLTNKELKDENLQQTLKAYPKEATLAENFLEDRIETLNQTIEKLKDTINNLKDDKEESAQTIKDYEKLSDLKAIDLADLHYQNQKLVIKYNKYRSLLKALASLL